MRSRPEQRSANAFVDWREQNDNAEVLGSALGLVLVPGTQTTPVCSRRTNPALAETVVKGRVVSAHRVLFTVIFVRPVRSPDRSPDTAHSAGRMHHM